LDVRAKTEYRDRLHALESELAEAESWNDSERASRLRKEIDFLTRELGAAVGLRGRDRRAASNAERARVNVTTAIKTALERIAEHSPSLCGHFHATVRTGTFCVYEPDPTRAGHLVGLKKLLVARAQPEIVLRTSGAANAGGSREIAGGGPRRVQPTRDLGDRTGGLAARRRVRRTRARTV